MTAELADWAGRREDVQAIAIVGSWARGTARPDSDVDVVIITIDPDRYVSTDDWAAVLGITGPLESKRWGVLTERRGHAASGLEIEFGITAPSWATTDPIDDGTLRVVMDGMRVVYDPEGILERLIRAAR